MHAKTQVNSIDHAVARAKKLMLLADACDPCHSNWYLVSSFLDYRPDIRLIFTLICSPLTLLATLWGKQRKWSPLSSSFVI
jgi:hypothetical protein